MKKYRRFDFGNGNVIVLDQGKILLLSLGAIAAIFFLVLIMKLLVPILIVVGAYLLFKYYKR